MWDDEVCNVVNLHTLLPLNITTSIQQIVPCFVDSSKDTWIWTASLNGQYNAKSGYTWLLSQHHNEFSQGSWSWIWKLHLSASLQFLLWQHATGLSN